MSKMEKKIETLELVYAILTFITVFLLAGTVGGIEMGNEMPLYIYIIDVVMLIFLFVLNRYTEILKERMRINEELQEQRMETTLYLKEKYKDMGY